eukprot:CAMPEP_0172554688 /NCGR_PEP_ID=MMETSP1067-20121228/55927_1 /TAXON_ID=265564 ORGANISM="Thalassiosira punctigera, Strain Tpunct2005C2" /NCGR_SAMPLE_ID=MMETSP1067 /ASSEMBLY_ACC=CAM_ASM_000444 /LENGTH=475 /DNA_ID=CAMNT_0013343111 /DNA_START=28 /DNA_END=1455 /DNA_ORIENTATION=+
MNDQENNDAERGNDQNPLAIESLDDYIRRYGLPHSNEDGPAGGEFNGLNRVEAIERVRAEESYRDKVIHQAHQETPREEKDDIDDGEAAAVVSVLLADKSTRPMQVRQLTAFCETAKRMVTSRSRYGVRDAVANEAVGDAKKRNAGATTPSQEEAENGGRPIMELSLVEFDADAVVQFMDVLISLHDHQQKRVSSETRDQTSRKRRMDDVTDEATNDHLTSLIDEEKISERHIVELLKIAHYLQCTSILETLVPIVQLSIDSHNCMAICSLADALNLKTLFEASVNYVIERLDAFQGTVSPDNSEGEGWNQRRSSSLGSTDDDYDDGERETAEEMWASLPHELRSRVLTMRNVMRSSVIGRGSKVSGLFFSSGSEFLAIFRETIRDQKERLGEARERGEEVIRERTEEWLIRCERRGRWFDSSSEAKKKFIYGADVVYALDKIEKQSRRLETLESFYDEQKVIFKGGGFESEIRL